MTPAQIVCQRLCDEAWERRHAVEQARRDERERITGLPWYDMPCRRGECPGPFPRGACCGVHPEAQTPEE